MCDLGRPCDDPTCSTGPRNNVPGSRTIVCPLCSQRWTEPRQRGACPGCGAGLNEMLWAYTEKMARERGAQLAQLPPIGGFHG